MRTQPKTLRLYVLCAVCAVLPGCATKKYVTAQVTAVTNRVQQVEKHNTEQDHQIDVLETDSSRTRENVLDLQANVRKLDSQLKTTSDTAQGAASAASQAQQQAADARTYAGTRADGLEQTIGNLDKYKLVNQSSVLFETGRSELGAESKGILDGIAQRAVEMRRFAVEIQGYTDSVGPATANLALSQRRAETVVRYLTVTRQVPLRNVHLIGAGSASPVGDNSTRQGRRQNRRVEVRLFAPELDGNTASTTAQSR